MISGSPMARKHHMDVTNVPNKCPPGCCTKFRRLFHSSFGTVPVQRNLRNQGWSQFIGASVEVDSFLSHQQSLK